MHLQTLRLDAGAELQIQRVHIRIYKTFPCILLPDFTQTLKANVFNKIV